MGDINANSGFDARQCIAKNLDQVLADQIQAGHIGAAQKLFSDCINTRALNESVQQQRADSKAGEEARDWKRKALDGGAADAQEPPKDQPKEQEKGGGLAAVIGMWQAPQLVSQAIDTLKSEVRMDLKEAHYAHPEYADMLDGVSVDDK
ncbi:MAG: hypothetical protein P4L53_14920 [Candidatus Obscuribacterales bacterium]|nr:hypothetical protein [Candidatus Obscuribacterales bacterium]